MRLLLVCVLLQLVLVQLQQVLVQVQLVLNLLQMVLQLKLLMRILSLKVMQPLQTKNQISQSVLHLLQMVEALNQEQHLINHYQVVVTMVQRLQWVKMQMQQALQL